MPYKELQPANNSVVGAKLVSSLARFTPHSSLGSREVWPQCGSQEQGLPRVLNTVSHGPLKAER